MAPPKGFTPWNKGKRKPDAERREYNGTWRSWVKMRQRCNNPKNERYKFYGGKGVKVCARWSVYENFLEDMGERPEGTSIERIDNDGNYEPRNCKWATSIEQNSNTSRRHELTFNGKTMSITEWSHELEINKATIHKRLDLGWSPEKALSKPVNVKYRALSKIKNKKCV